jgi:predicted RNA methylase
MYGELRRAPLIRIFEIFKRDCNFTTNSVFVDLGCGLGKSVYLASKCGIRESIGIEEEKRHLDVMRKSMERLEAQDVKIIQGLVEEHLNEVHHGTHFYSFDWVFSHVTLDAIYAFMRMRSQVYWATFQKPGDLTEKGLKFQLLEKIDGKMARTREGHKCYVYQIV